MDSEQDEVDADSDRLVAVHHGSGYRLVVLEEIQQQALLVRRVAKREPRCNTISNQSSFISDFLE